MTSHRHPPPAPAPRPPGFTRCMVVLVAVLLAHAQSLTAQVAGPPTELEAFKQLRSQFQFQILAQSKTLTEQYERALARLELDLAEAGDYEQALQVKQRRDQLDQIYHNADPSLTPSIATPLTAAAAKGSGINAYDDGSLAGWRSSSHFAEWAAVKIAPGDYFLELDYLMVEAPLITSSTLPTTETKALFEFFEVSLLAGASENRRSFELELSNTPSTYTPLRVGPVRYSRSPVTLRLNTARSYPGFVIRMKNLRLVPAPTAPTTSIGTTIASPAAPPSSPSTNQIDIPTLRGNFAKSLEQAHQPIHQIYLAQLRDLSRSHPDWKPFTDAEEQAIQRRIAGKKNNLSIPNLPKPLASLGGISGFQDLEDVTFVPHPDNTGDRFRVRHDDQEFFIRLLWIRCGQPAPVGTAIEETAFSKLLDLSPEDAALFGRAALEFTTGYLEGKTFRLLARNNPDADGTLPALLFLPDIGLYHNVLIDQGLAAVSAKFVANGTIERALFRSIEEREADARRREPRPGAWALSSTPSLDKP